MSKRKKIIKSHRYYNNKVINIVRLLDILKQCRSINCCPLRNTARSFSIQSNMKDPIEIFGTIDSSEYDILQKGDKLFKMPSNYCELSVVNRNNELNDFLIPKGYYETAIDGLKKIRETQNNSVKDSLIYPVLYNFRHYLEITMKDTIRNFKISKKEISPEQVGYIGGHSLLDIWKKLKPYLPLNEEQTDECKTFEELINEINEIDNQSFSFRYSYKRPNEENDARESILNNCIDIDVENLERVIKRMHFYLERISNYASIQREEEN